MYDYVEAYVLGVIEPDHLPFRLLSQHSNFHLRQMLFHPNFERPILWEIFKH